MLDPRRLSRPARVLACLIVGAACVTAVPADAAAQPAAVAVTMPGPETDEGRSPESERLRRLHEQEVARSGDVERARTALELATTAAQDSLERYTLAVRALNAAQTEENARRDALRAAQFRLAEQRDNLGRWARTAYRSGRSFEAGFGLATVLQSRTTDDLAVTSSVLRQIGRSQSRVVEGVAVAERSAETAAAEAGRAAVTAEAAAVAASAEKARSDAAVQAQQQELDRSQDALSAAQDAATAAARREQALAAAAALSRIGGNVVTGPVGSCTGADVALYPNGQIPLSALCPLAGAPGHYLRADAANAFDWMSNAFAARFGTPICVTDSYRTYEQQVRLRAEKPALAAVPGTSNHGWGTATDLCGGIQNFGSEQHAWLLANAPGYGWFAPSWARADGSKPEPWHWEFAG